MQYKKPWKSHAEQLEELIERGLEVSDRERALNYLERIGYYRLSGYWFPFRKRSGPVSIPTLEYKRPKKVVVQRIALDEFYLGATFQNALDLYVFDKRLRLLCLDALERIEISLRVDIAHLLGKYHRFAYLKPELFDVSFSEKLDNKTGITRHQSWLGKHAQLINRSKEDFVRHNKSKYGLPLAIWVACEVWDFGTLSTLYGGMKVEDQDTIAQKYGMENGRIFATWLRSFNYLRNVCAHHSRLWNRNIIDQPRLPTAEELPWVRDFEQSNHARARCFLLLRMVNHVLRAVNPTSTWFLRMHNQLLDFPSLSHVNINLKGMGVPDGWQDDWFDRQ